jgi:hypothetical protein
VGQCWTTGNVRKREKGIRMRDYIGCNGPCELEEGWERRREVLRGGASSYAMRSTAAVPLSSRATASLLHPGSDARRRARSQARGLRLGGGGADVRKGWGQRAGRGRRVKRRGICRLPYPSNGMNVILPSTFTRDWHAPPYHACVEGPFQ